MPSPLAFPAQPLALVVDKLWGFEGAKPPGSLVKTGHNSTKLNSKDDEVCPDGGWLEGVCLHGTKRWIKLSCKRRACRVCGKERKRRIAARIQLGLSILGKGAWMVGTFAANVTKKYAVGVEGKFIRWARKRLGHFEYAATWELTEAGRLHVNIIMAPWPGGISQKALSAAWRRFGGGPVVWIKRIDSSIGLEVAKVGSRQIANYVAKWDQMVQSGRGVCYSRGWPKLPDPEKMERRGEVHWRWVGNLEGEAQVHQMEEDQGYWQEVAWPGEWQFCLDELCDCFEPVEQDLWDRMAKLREVSDGW